MTDNVKEHSLTITNNKSGARVFIVIPNESLYKMIYDDFQEYIYLEKYSKESIITKIATDKENMILKVTYGKGE